MQINTADGWKQLQPRTIVAGSERDERYRGQLPSLQVMTYLRWLETEIAKQRAARLQTHAQAA